MFKKTFTNLSVYIYISTNFLTIILICYSFHDSHFDKLNSLHIHNVLKIHSVLPHKTQNHLSSHYYRWGKNCQNHGEQRLATKNSNTEFWLHMKGEALNSIANSKEVIPGNSRITVASWLRADALCSDPIFSSYLFCNIRKIIKSSLLQFLFL